MSQALTIVQPATLLPVTVEALKVHIRLLGDDGTFDLLLSNLIGAATSVFERQTNRVVMQRQLALHLDRFPSCTSGDGNGGLIYLPAAPVTAVNSLKYLDPASQWIIMDAADYHADTAHVPARVASTSAWPSTRTLLGAVMVTFTSGYAAQADVPADIAAAIKMLAAHYFENPEAASAIDLKTVPMAVQTIMDSYFVPRVA